MFIITIRDIIGLAFLAILFVCGGGYIAWAAFSKWLARRKRARQNYKGKA